MHKIDILGVKYTIYEKCDIGTKHGECDCSTKTIRLSENLYRPAIANEQENRKAVLQLTLRHEILHAFFHEAGIECGFGMHEEYNINWLAVMYDKINKIFTQLDIAVAK